MNKTEFKRAWSVWRKWMSDAITEREAYAQGLTSETAAVAGKVFWSRDCETPWHVRKASERAYKATDIRTGIAYRRAQEPARSE